MKKFGIVISIYSAGTAAGILAYQALAKAHHPTVGAGACVTVMAGAAVYAERWWP